MKNVPRQLNRVLGMWFALLTISLSSTWGHHLTLYRHCPDRSRDPKTDPRHLWFSVVDR